jgi:hypothetical protein
VTAPTSEGTEPRTDIDNRSWRHLLGSPGYSQQSSFNHHFAFARSTPSKPCISCRACSCQHEMTASIAADLTSNSDTSNCSASAQRDAPLPFPQVCAEIHNRVTAFLNESDASPRLKDLQERTRISLRVIEQALDQYRYVVRMRCLFCLGQSIETLESRTAKPSNRNQWEAPSWPSSSIATATGNFPGATGYALCHPTFL